MLGEKMPSYVCIGLSETIWCVYVCSSPRGGGQSEWGWEVTEGLCGAKAPYLVFSSSLPSLVGG